jgi:hypothetical protein
MQFAQPEFLLLSRTGRVGGGTAVTGRPSPRELARREQVAQASRRRVRRARRFRALRSRSGAAVTAAVAKRS